MARFTFLIAVLSCRDPDEMVIRCNGELVEMIAWREAVETDLRLQRADWTPETLAAEEKRRVEATAAAVRERLSLCRNNWHTLLYQAPTYPSLRLREEALLLVFGAAPHDYPPESIGFAGVSTAGRAPVVGLELK